MSVTDPDGGPGADEILFVENTRGGDLHAIDLATGKTISRIGIGDHPDDVIANGAGDRLYMSVMRYSSDGINDDPLSDPGYVLALDPASEEIIWRVEIGGEPNHIILSPDERFLYVPVFNSTHLEVVDTAKAEVVARVPVGYMSHGTRLSPDGRRLYVGCFTDHLAVVDRECLKVERWILTDEAVRPFAIDADERYLYAQQSRMHGFVVIDLSCDEVVKTVHLPPLTKHPFAFRKWHQTVNHGLEISPDGKLLFVAGSAEDYVVVYSLPSLERISVIPVGAEPNWIIFTRDQKLALVSNRADDSISVLSVDELKEVRRLTGGNYPQRMATVPRSVRE